MKKTLCGIIAGLTLLMGCEFAPKDNGRELNGDVKVPNECGKVYNFGYNYAASRYFVACQKEDKGFSFYTKRPGVNDWKEIRFIANGNYLQGEQK